MLVLFNQTIISQKDYADKTNQLNSQGQKEGLWVEDDENDIDYIYFHNGEANGMFYRIKKCNNSLTWFGELSNGEYVGTYYIFSDYGHLIFACNNFTKNTDSISLSNIVPESKCYCINYYPNGFVESEGFLLFSDSPSFDSFEYGEWKYYDENGKLTETKVFK